MNTSIEKKLMDWKTGGQFPDWRDCVTCVWEGLEFGVNQWKLLHLEWVSDEILPYSTGNSIQKGDNVGKRTCIYIEVWFTLLSKSNEAISYNKF